MLRLTTRVWVMVITKMGVMEWVMVMAEMEVRVGDEKETGFLDCLALWCLWCNEMAEKAF